MSFPFIGGIHLRPREQPSLAGPEEGPDEVP